ncbi:hypothetical protein HCN44_008545 [Aphidius gifuensis]|uniref:Tyrosine-protein kinase receptor n=2 Tax=Aphidius gifuensis TaxID=684658 RepID=A0A834XPR6_APHGI|nr:hypothetical protein HCN44_008545 [Aphidius gifuensis]
MIFLVLIFVSYIFALLPDDTDEHQVIIAGTFQEDCAARCSQNHTDILSQENICGIQIGVHCKIDQCTKHCASWEQALETDCPSVCNGTQKIPTGEEINCVMYCNAALDYYFEQLKAEIGILPAPALVADSLTATSLRLEWKGIDIKHRPIGVQYLVQWQYEEHADDWQYCRNQSWDENDQMIFVDNLQPYKKYRFRVTLLLKSSQHNPKPIVSDPSVVIQTLAAGRPTSAPVIVRAVAVDSYRVSVSWEPGPFPNGPLLSYVLQLQGANDSLLNKDIPAAENIHHYLFQNLKSNQTYTGSVRERNAVGDGPPAIFKITTSPLPEVTDTQQPILIVSGKYVIKKQGADMLDEPTIIYNSKSKIRGVAIDISSDKLFVSNSNGSIITTSIIKTSKETTILRSKDANFKPLSLSVDWLNLHLYILGEVNHSTRVWQISRCNFDGKYLTAIKTGFLTKPSHIEVDPFNGYLFWITKNGLYRLDLADINKHEIQPYLILEDSNLGGFTVDHRNFRLLVSHQTQNTVVSVSLDGKECIDIRNNTQQSQLKNVVSLGTANGLFYWTNGTKVFSEGYFPQANKYFHNIFSSSSNDTFITIHVLINTSQPIPVPVNPPTGLQAILGSKIAKISWKVPHLLGGQGKGAWQNWTYELELKNNLNNNIIRQDGIAGTSYTISNLNETTQYTIKIAAYTDAGHGPWSSEFNSKTLHDNSYASILWSANEGLLKSDVTGENIDTLIQKDTLNNNNINKNYIVDVSWYKDTLYIVDNNTYLYKYNISNNNIVKFNNINSVGSVAIDWIGKKIYWASPKQHIITRSNLNGTQQELVSVIAIVKELIIDSKQAYLYWSTSHTVEVARLNGLDPRLYYSENVFNGIQVMGLTLDTENHYVYWIVRSYEAGSIVYRAPTSERISIKHKIIPEKVSSLQHPNMQGPLCYFSEHLLWLQDDKNAVIGDLTGQNTAVINGISLIGLHMITIMDPQLHQYPNNLTSDNIIVIPDSIDADTIKVIGTWNNFNITWKPIDNINYGTVFYEIKFTDYINSQINSQITNETTIIYNNCNNILPYTLLDITIKSFTYWGSSLATKKTLRSPQDIPSQPTNIRSFIEYKKSPINHFDTDIFITLRWSLPKFTNGLINGYLLKFWYAQNQIDIYLCDHVNVTNATMEYEVHNLIPNTTYSFEIQAYTDIGHGPFSDTINISTDYENPVPQLIVTTTDSIKLYDYDLNISKTITKNIPIDIKSLNYDSKLFWINDKHEIITSSYHGGNLMKILTLNNTATSLCIDWVSRNLYWSEKNIDKTNKITWNIWKLDIDAWEDGNLIVANIVTRNFEIVNIEISPLTDNLYWIELAPNDNHGIIMQSNLNGNNIKTFLNNADDCTCPNSPLVIPIMTIDNSELKNPLMYWISIDGDLNIATIDGCACSTVITSSFNQGLPPSSLTVDKTNIYWSSLAKNETYYVNKMYPDEENIKVIDLSDIHIIRSIGKSLQPYPSFDCLVPYQMSYKIEEIININSNSITVKLPDPKINLACEKYNLAGIYYTIYITKCLDYQDINCSDIDKNIIHTYNKEIKINNLSPFTIYDIKLLLNNYYTKLEGLPLLNNNDNSIKLITAPGVPTVPQNITVEALNPTLAAVHWLPPKILNSPSVRYEIHWRSSRLVNGARQTGELLVKNIDDNHGNEKKYTAFIEPLLPGQNYSVYVKAFSINSTDAYSESETKILSMYPQPNNLILDTITISSINLSWLPTPNITIKYTLQYTTIIGTENWQTAEPIKNHDDDDDGKIKYNINNLLSSTIYKFRLILKYPNDKGNFVWLNDVTFQTLGDVPSAPGIPTVTKLRNSLYQLNWLTAQAHGSQITMYLLEGKIIKNINDNDDELKEQQWNIYYNGTDNYWIIVGEMNNRYKFRVKAKNSYGFGEWSLTSDIIDLQDTIGTTIADQQHLGIILGLSIPIITIILLCFCYFLCLYNRQRKNVKKQILPPIITDVELATLREIPRSNFVQSNALYATSMQIDNDDLLLPKINKEQIVRIKFLGSGAFGEVYQGTAKGIENTTDITKIAIKTLRKGATANEKIEFLQEAQLMSHFKHKHVLRLLGVCIDPDGPQLVLELMEAGDLLTYLRTSRFYLPTDNLALRLQDLLSMCEDVARGCRYLEELHFVHRDLACRNCLVSAKDRDNRVVKIGDFGLARDIYKNDYYRKEGEGLLPVRWMSPESLIDGVFTTQSDVWAFGVLMWEITSLGQQPYPAKSNSQVLVYVRNGGRLVKPDNCPETLYNLMQRCWSEADTRPSFKNCLDKIIVLKKNTTDAILTPIQAGHYATRRGVSNMAYFADENQNHNNYNSGNSWKSSSSDGSRDMKPFLQNSTTTTTQLSDSTNDDNNNIPKYLELIPGGALDAKDNNNQIDEYEIPRSLPINHTFTAEDRKNIDNILSKIGGTLNSITDKNQKLLNTNNGLKIIPSLTNDLRLSLNEKIKIQKQTSNEGSQMSLDDCNYNSLASSINSLRLALPPTRPSSSMLDSQNNNLNDSNNNNETNKTINNSTLRLNKIHKNIIGKANIPLNSPILNLLRQTTGIDETTGINTIYVNTDSTRVN